MDEENFENNDSPNIEPEDTQDENLDEDSSEELDVEELKQRNQSLYEQLKKAKGFVRDDSGKWVKKPEPVKETTKPLAESKELSSRDMFALVKADVHEDDIDDVIKVAKLEGISIAEAVKLDLTKTILAKKSEYRRSAQVSNSAPARRGPQKMSDEAILSGLSEGKVPDKGSEEAERLFWARRGGKR